MDTRLVLRPWRQAPRGILSGLAAGLLALLAGAGVTAQERPKKGARDPRDERLASATPLDSSAEKAKAKAPPGNPAAAVAWKRLTTPVIEQYFARHPDRALERARPEARELALGTHGVGATLRWREALQDALAGLARLDVTGAGRDGRLLGARFTDWLEAELILLEAQTLATADPASYVERAGRVLRAADEAVWLTPEERAAKLAALLAALPDYFRDARVSLVAPAPQWIDVAVQTLDDLELVVAALDVARPEPAPQPKPSPPKPVTAKPAAAKPGAAKPGAAAAKGAGAKAPKKPGAKPAATPKPEPTPSLALESFERWLLELRPGAGGEPPRLDADEWQRLVRLASGSEWSPGELKSRCLRELARLDLAAHAAEPRKKRLDADGLGLRVSTAASAALRLAQTARVLPGNLDPRGVGFLMEESPRTDPRLAALRPGPEKVVRVFLRLPHRAWTPELVATRQAALGTTQQAALGIRYGLTGEALLVRRGFSASAPPMLLENRLLREGLGLFALDWIARIDWMENAFRDDIELARELEFQRGYEAARLVAALELHAEGLSLDEAALGFQRRTGSDAGTARAEVLAAQRDPQLGLGYLGYLELRALEERLAALTSARKATRLVLLLVQRHPELRPADLVQALAGARKPQR